MRHDLICGVGRTERECAQAKEEEEMKFNLSAQTTRYFHMTCPACGCQFLFDARDHDLSVPTSCLSEQEVDTSCNLAAKTWHSGHRSLAVVGGVLRKHTLRYVSYKE